MRGSPAQVTPDDHVPGLALWRWLFAVSAVRAVVPDFLDVLSRGFRSFDLQLSAVVGRAPVATLAGEVLDVALVTLAMMRLAHLTVAGGARRPLPAAAVLLMATSVQYTLLVVEDFHLTRGMVVFGLTLTALVVCPPAPDRALADFARLGLLGLAASWLTAFASPSVGWLTTSAADSGDRLSLVPGLRLAGVFSHPNMLGYVSTALLASALMSPRVPRRRLLVVVSVVTLVGCGSRTALATALLVGVLWFAKGTIGRCMRVGAAAAVLICAYLPAQGTVGFVASVGREEIWVMARRVWVEQPIVGHGLDFWQSGRAQATGFPTFAYHAHNQVLDNLVLGGLVATSLIAAYLGIHAVTMARWSRQAGTPVPALSAALLCTAISEVPIQFLLVDPRFVVLIVATIAVDGWRIRRQTELEQDLSLPDIDPAGGPQMRLQGADPPPGKTNRSTRIRTLASDWRTCGTA